MLLRVDDDVADERQPDLPGGEDHVAVDRVALENSGSGPFVRNKLRAVIRHHRRVACHAGKHALAASRETGEEVRLDEPLRDEQVGLDRQLIEYQIASGRQGSYVNETRIVMAVVDNNAFVLHNLGPILLQELPWGGGAVSSGRDKDGDFGIGVPRPHLFEEQRHDNGAWNGAGMVA